jgi:uncharacterized membrane protein HdeD (DUF308 family)
MVGVTSPAAWLGIFLGMVTVLPGLWALHAYLTQGAERPAFLGLVLSLLGIALVLPLTNLSARSSSYSAVAGSFGAPGPWLTGT